MRSDIKYGQLLRYLALLILSIVVALLRTQKNSGHSVAYLVAKPRTMSWLYCNSRLFVLSLHNQPGNQNPVKGHRDNKMLDFEHTIKKKTRKKIYPQFK